MGAPKLSTMSINRQSKMLQHINYRMRVTISDQRHLIGRFMAFDRHMNLVLGDCEEYRRITNKKKGGEEREKAYARVGVGARGDCRLALSGGPSSKGERRQDDWRAWCGTCSRTWTPYSSNVWTSGWTFWPCAWCWWSRPKHDATPGTRGSS